MNDLSNRVRLALVETLRLNIAELPLTLDADSLPAWDSLGHMSLIARLEEEFSIEIPHNQAVELISEEQIISVLNRIIETEG